MIVISNNIVIGKDILQGRTIYYDTTTKNESFIEIANILRLEGIKHNKFPLMIYDRSLIGIDPWDPNLDMVTKAKIINEVIHNYWYFIREVIRVMVPGGKIRYKLHRGNLAEAFCMINNINQILLLPRQHFKTQSAAIVYLWQMLFVSRNYQYLFGHKAVSGSQDNLKRVKDAMEGLPKYLLSGIDKQKDTFNVQSILIKSRNNQIKLLGSPSSAAGADRQGRGATSPCVWLDEFAFIKYNDIMFGALVPANSTASDLAKENGTPYSIVITTTPNNLDTDDGAYCKSMIDMAWRFDEHMYDWWFDNGESYLHDYINDPSHSGNGFVYIEFSYKQLGKDDVWLESQKRALQGDLTLVKRELLLEWTLGSNTSPFSEEQLDTLSQGIIKDPFGRIYLLDNKYSIIMLKNIRNTANKNYVIGVDVGGGLGRDASAITIIDPANQEPVGIFKNNHIAITELAYMLEELITLYLPKAVLIPERNNGGITLIEILEKTSVDSNLYYRTKTSQGIERISTEAPNIYDMKQSALNKNKKTMIVKGVDTTAKSRDLMINEILFNIVTNRPELINNDSMLDEIKTLERKKTGKIEHADKKHDDQIFSFLIGLYPIFFDPNIGKFLTNLSDGIMTVSDKEEDENVNSKEKQIKRSIKSTLELSRNRLMAKNSLPSDISALMGNYTARRSIEDDERELQEMRKPVSNRSVSDKLNRFKRNYL